MGVEEDLVDVLVEVGVLVVVVEFDFGEFGYGVGGVEKRWN